LIAQSRVHNLFLLNGLQSVWQKFVVNKRCKKFPGYQQALHIAIETPHDNRSDHLRWTGALTWYIGPEMEQFTLNINPLTPTVAIWVQLAYERQSARMSNITNDSLIRSGTGCFIG